MSGRTRRRKRRGGLPYLRLVIVLIAVSVAVRWWPRPPVAQVAAAARIWQIQSVDTMKTSRDKARAELNNQAYDAAIEAQVKAIHEVGATHVAVGTPYDDEFLPYLQRWVRAARRYDLKVWFRGNFARWEGWFDYPKDMSPEEHLAATKTFIETHAGLFEDGDVFDPCPECENAGYWPQPEKNSEYNAYLVEQHNAVTAAFNKIGKNGVTNAFSVIGGRAREVVDAGTAASLDHVITIDHYVKDPASFDEYIGYFAGTLTVQTLLGEFGAPIPDINGGMSDTQQADYVGAVLKKLYHHKNDILGMNYYVLSEGTTSLLDENGSPKEVFKLLKSYYRPMIILGTVTNPLGDVQKDVTVKTADGISHTTTTDNGRFSLAVPAMDQTLVIEHADYFPTEKLVTGSTEKIDTEKIVLEPRHKGFIYNIRSSVKSLL
ncbi:carboxypeptidase regulatory-like domain-containing protein [Candidatus Microgenomates bacterium]|nr:carboxypeptidase regulatory-like domain-containing protein [Candidatus Microgenomates bacterium]